MNSNNVHQLYELLDIHPWQKQWSDEALQWLFRHWQWSIVFGLFMLSGFLHHLWVQYLVNRRTTELKMANEQSMQQQLLLEHAQRVAILGELSSDIAHELGQPLAAISNYADGGIVRLERNSSPADDSATAVIDSTFDSVALTVLLEKIHLEAQRGGKIIKNIRSFAQKKAVTHRPVDLMQLTRDTLELLNYDLRKHAVEVEIFSQCDALVVSADQLEVQQIFVNLIRNAIDAAHAEDKQPILKIELATNGAGAVWSVTDNGPGFSQQDTEDAFKSFSTTKHDGLGLGLSICRKIMLMNNGTIDAENLPEGGAVVRCVFERQ